MPGEREDMDTEREGGVSCGHAGPNVNVNAKAAARMLSSYKSRQGKQAGHVDQNRIATTSQRVGLSSVKLSQSRRDRMCVQEHCAAIRLIKSIRDHP